MCSQSKLPRALLKLCAALMAFRASGAKPNSSIWSLATHSQVTSPFHDTSMRRSSSSITSATFGCVRFVWVRISVLPPSMAGMLSGEK
jgi:hypothetical protein